MVAQGRLSNGKTFPLPQTRNLLETLKTSKACLTPFGLAFPSVIIGLIAIHCLNWLVVKVPAFSIFHFFCWRLAYNVGLGFLLYKQSHEQYMTKRFSQLMKNPRFKEYFEKSVAYIDKEGKYKASEYPAEYNAWLLFRFLVNVVLAGDFITYTAVSLTYFEPWEFSIVAIAVSIVGLFLCFFALWSKSDAHRVLGDYAWYWGDFFFLLSSDALVFDGIFQMFPHPMYTVGYCFMYGFALIARSYTLFYVSVATHVLQLIFLTFVENPHIERTYNSYKEDDKDVKKHDNLYLIFNWEFYRSSDLFQMVICVYIVLCGLFISDPTFHFIHAIVWRLVHAGLYFILYKQSTRKSWTRAYTKHGWSLNDAFDGWKKVFNLSLTVQHVTVGVAAWTFFDASVVTTTRVLVGLGLIGLNFWCSTSCYEVIGDFGFFYGDFFFEKVDKKLEYHGIYRYLNNPDSVMGFAAAYGLALISGSYRTLILAAMSHVIYLGATRLVEKPHMEKLYGTTVREEGGIASEVKRKGQSLIVEARETVKEMKIKTNDLKQKAIGIIPSQSPPGSPRTLSPSSPKSGRSGSS